MIDLFNGVSCTPHTLKWLLHYLNKHAPSAFLEICWSSDTLIKQYKNFENVAKTQYTCLDINPKSTLTPEVRNESPSTFEYLNSIHSLENLPFKREQFPIVCVRHCLERQPFYVKVLEELTRITKEVCIVILSRYSYDNDYLKKTKEGYLNTYQIYRLRNGVQRCFFEYEYATILKGETPSRSLYVNPNIIYNGDDVVLLCYKNQFAAARKQGFDLFKELAIPYVAKVPGKKVIYKKKIFQNKLALKPYSQ